ncbi:FAD-dependent oxidoreductase [Streptomyces triculaminicus]|uniref:FAD-dependent oxidoreductase n=1 Tax=Streptomyces triculaminicus TaxID=2816232 RepID=UPI0037A0EAAE
MTGGPKAGFGHAVICGGGFAGLLTAHVLTEFFDRVTIIERDRLSDGQVVRPGIPQAHHVHGMMARGAHILEEFFPGLREELRQAGAPVFDFGAAFPVLTPAGWTPRNKTGIQAQSFNRTTLEARIRARVLAHPHITLLDGHVVCGLSAPPGRTEVDGVLVRPATAGEPTTVAADLVIDAQGRSSRLPRWLAEAGWTRPTTSVVDARYAYASRLYTQPAASPPQWVCTLQMTYAPDVPRGGAVATVDGRRWVVSLMGAAGNLPPTAPEEFEAFAAALDNPYIADAIRLGEPLSPVRCFTNLANRWHRYDHLQKRHVERLIVLGDALCTFNPVYGQGMTVAAIQATVLRDLLRARRPSGCLDGVARVFQKRAACSVRLPWLIATSSDLGWQETTPGAFTQAVRWYLARVLAHVPRNPELYRRFVLVQHMLKGPAILLSPHVLAAVLAPPITPRRNP